MKRFFSLLFVGILLTLSILAAAQAQQNPSIPFTAPRLHATVINQEVVTVTIKPKLWVTAQVGVQAIAVHDLLCNQQKNKHSAS